MGPERCVGSGEGEDATKAYLIPGLSPLQRQLGGEAGRQVTQGSTHTLLLVTGPRNQPFQ